MLTKTKIIAARQCAKKAWMMEHRKDASSASAENVEARVRGSQLGIVAQSLYSKPHQGVVVNPFEDGFAHARKETLALLEGAAPIFEGTFASDDVLVMSDILCRAGDGWKMVEIKSGTQLKAHYVDDLAVQVAIARKAGARITQAVLGLVNSDFVYAGAGDYDGLIAEVNVTDTVSQIVPLIDQWIDDARAIIASDKEPSCTTGQHCKAPYECEFMAYCQAQETQVSTPAAWLPNVRAKALKSLLNDQGVKDMADIPDSVLNEQQAIVKASTLSGRVYFDQDGARKDLAGYAFPVRFLDFETSQFVVPVWAGTRPYQQIPFQASIHSIDEAGKLSHVEYLDLSGSNPLRGMAEFLVDHCGESGAIFAYYASFELARIKEMIALFPDLAPALFKIAARVVDLLPIANKRYYHPEQRGSWSIKRVLPTIAPELAYDGLDGVADGVMAMSAYQEAIEPSTSMNRREEIRAELSAYCERDTLGLVRIWSHFTGCPA